MLMEPHAFFVRVFVCACGWFILLALTGGLGYGVFSFFSDGQPPPSKVFPQKANQHVADPTPDHTSELISKLRGLSAADLAGQMDTLAHGFSEAFIAKGIDGDMVASWLEQVGSSPSASSSPSSSWLQWNQPVVIVILCCCCCWACWKDLQT